MFEHGCTRPYYQLNYKTNAIDFFRILQIPACLLPLGWCVQRYTLYEVLLSLGKSNDKLSSPRLLDGPFCDICPFGCPLTCCQSDG